jgi:hypothetical protein
MKEGDIDRVLSLISESFMKEKNTLNLIPTPLLISFFSVSDEERKR